MPRTRQPRAALSRDRIVDVALNLIDAEGLGALSMRRLGAALGVEAMTLYHYVPGKAALLDLVVERVTLRAATAEMLESDWRQRLAGFARRYRASLIAHPRALPLISTRPLRSSAGLGQFAQALTGMVEQGFAPTTAYFALQAVAMLVIGMAIAEAGEPAPDVEPSQDAAAEADYAQALRALFADAEALEHRHQAAFDFALEALLDGLSLRRA